jgi:hypothetical protein
MTEIYCNWAKGMAIVENLPDACDPKFVVDGKCNHCATSPQIELGANPNDLLKINLYIKRKK